jgi:hypothetical protein
LVDAQAPGLASAVRRLGEDVGASARWPSKLLNGLGLLALTIHGYGRVSELSEPLQADVLQLVGFPQRTEDVLEKGERLKDRWLIVGQRHEFEDKLRVQRNWLLGLESKRVALFLQFSAGGTPFSEAMIPGFCFDAELAFYQSAFPMRALIASRSGESEFFTGRFFGHGNLGEFLNELSEAVAKLPWITLYPCLLRDVTPTTARDRDFFLIDGEKQSLPYEAKDPYQLYALAGGKPIDIAGEWDGETIRVLGAMAGGRYHLLEKPTGG